MAGMMRRNISKNILRILFRLRSFRLRYQSKKPNES